MACEECVLYSRVQDDPNNPSCLSCMSDPADKGYCVALKSEFDIVPVISKIDDETRAREIMRRGVGNGNNLQLLHWSEKKSAYLFA